MLMPTDRSTSRRALDAWFEQQGMTPTIVGEFDALPGLSQEASPFKKAISDGGPGHGCGHHRRRRPCSGHGRREKRRGDSHQNTVRT